MSTILTDEQRAVVLANVPLVEHIVNRVAANLPASHSRDDLVQTGIIGLIGATVRYDPDQGAAFSTFAGRRIEGAVIDMLRRADWAPRSVRSMERRLATAEEQRSALQSPSVDQLSRELGCDPADIHHLRNDIARARLDSLDRPVGSDDSVVPLSDTIVDRGERAEEIVDRHELLGYLRDGVALLPERHRMVVVGYFFEGRSITDLGLLLGVSQSRASQIKDEALKLLRNGLQRAYQEPGPTRTEPAMTSRQRSFVDSVADSRSWRDRLDAGKGVSITG